MRKYEFDAWIDSLGPTRRAIASTSITLCLPLVIIWAFIEELLRGLKSAFGDAWCAVKIEIHDYRRIMASFREPRA